MAQAIADKNFWEREKIKVNDGGLRICITVNDRVGKELFCEEMVCCQLVSLEKRHGLVCKFIFAFPLVSMQVFNMTKNYSELSSPTMRLKCSLRSSKGSGGLNLKP